MMALPMAYENTVATTPTTRAVGSTTIALAAITRGPAGFRGERHADGGVPVLLADDQHAEHTGQELADVPPASEQAEAVLVLDVAAPHGAVIEDRERDRDRRPPGASSTRFERAVRSLIHSERMAFLTRVTPGGLAAAAQRRGRGRRSGPVLLRRPGALEEGLLERRRLRRELVQHDAEARRQLADGRGGRRRRRPRRPARRVTVAPRAGAPGRAPPAAGAADPHPGAGVASDEVADRGVGDQPAAAR